MKKLLSIASLAFLTPLAYAGDQAVSPKPYVLTEFGGLPITNSMVTGWVLSLVIIICVRLMVGGKPKLVPSRGQAILETLLEGIKGVIAPIVGRHMFRPTFPLLVGFFLFILINNWSGLLPGVGTFGHYDENGHLLYYFRPANADLNMTLGLAVVSMIAWVYYVLRYEGLKSFAYHLFGNKADRKELPFFIYGFLFIIFFLVGVIELISILFRLVSLSFRLYGNIFGGENLLVSIHSIYKWVLPVPFYFLEALIGLIQAFVFTLLVAVYIGLVCNHGDEEMAH